MIEISGNVAVLNRNPNVGKPPTHLERGGSQSRNYSTEGSLALKPKSVLRPKPVAELPRRKRMEQKGETAYKEGTVRTKERTKESQATASRTYRKHRILMNRIFLGTLTLATAVLGWEVLGPPASEKATGSNDQSATSHEDVYQGEIPSATAYQEILNRTPTMTEAEIGEGQLDTATAPAELTAEGIESRRQENYQALRRLAVERWIYTEGDDLEAYVPLHNGSPAASDGITGPYGYNFAGRTETMLRRDGFNEQEVTAFLPWTKLYGQEALNHITMNPYIFSERQKELMKESNIRMILDDGLEKYREKGLELLDLDWRIAAATLQPRGLFGPNLDFSEYQGEDNVFGDLAQYEVNLENQNWLAAANNYANVIRRYWEADAEFRQGWGNRFYEYFKNDLLPAILEARPDLAPELLAVTSELNETRSA